MKRSASAFFGRSIPPRCEYCAHSTPDGCQCGRTFPEEGVCKAYRYDPLLRVPLTPPPLPKYDPEEFNL